MEYDDLENRFTYHPPVDAYQTETYEVLRDHARRYADLIDRRVPDCREKSLAITKLEEVVMWANAGMARHYKLPE